MSVFCFLLRRNNIKNFIKKPTKGMKKSDKVALQIYWLSLFSLSEFQKLPFYEELFKLQHYCVGRSRIRSQPTTVRFYEPSIAV